MTFIDLRGVTFVPCIVKYAKLLMETRVAKLEQNIGEIKTDIAVIKNRLDHLERNVATKADIAEIRTGTKADMAEIRAGTKADMAEIRASAKADIAELKAAIADTKSDITRWLVSTLIAGIGVASAIAFGIAKFVPSQPPQIQIQLPDKVLPQASPTPTGPREVKPSPTR